MEKYQIKKAGIGLKINPPFDLKGRVFEDETFGLVYIMNVKNFKVEYLGYPALILAPLSTGSIHPFVCYISEDEETWAGEITTLSGKKVDSIDTTIYFK